MEIKRRFYFLTMILILMSYAADGNSQHWEQFSDEELHQHRFPGGTPRIVTQKEIEDNPYQLDVTTPGCHKAEEFFPQRDYFSRDVEGTQRQVWLKDLSLGNGREVTKDSTVVLRYWDDWRSDPIDESFWKEQHPIRPEYHLHFNLGDKNIGNGIQTAILGMKEKGRREAFIRLDLAEGLTTSQFKGAFVEFEVLEVK